MSLACVCISKKKKKLWSDDLKQFTSNAPCPSIRNNAVHRL